MRQAASVERSGGPEVLRLREADPCRPGAVQVRPRDSSWSCAPRPQHARLESRGSSGKLILVPE